MAANDHEDDPHDPDAALEWVRHAVRDAVAKRAEARAYWREGHPGSRPAQYGADPVPDCADTTDGLVKWVHERRGLAGLTRNDAWILGWAVDAVVSKEFREALASAGHGPNPSRARRAVLWKIVKRFSYRARELDIRNPRSALGYACTYVARMAPDEAEAVVHGADVNADAVVQLEVVCQRLAEQRAQLAAEKADHERTRAELHDVREQALALAAASVAPVVSAEQQVADQLVALRGELRSALERAETAETELVSVKRDLESNRDLNRVLSTMNARLRSAAAAAQAVPTTP